MVLLGCRVSWFVFFSVFFLMIRRPPRSTLFSLHDALPISSDLSARKYRASMATWRIGMRCPTARSEERFSRNAETDIVCRLLLDKKRHYRVDAATPHSLPTTATPTSLHPTSTSY